MIVMVIMIKIIINKLNNSNHRERLIIILVTMCVVCCVFQQKQLPSYLYIYIFFSCYSYVGKIGGSQPINLERRCWSSGIVAHEIGNLFL